MKKLMVLGCLILAMGFAVALDLSKRGQYRLWKATENHVKIQRTITDSNGSLIVVWEQSFGIDEVNQELEVAKEQVKFYDMSDIDAIVYIASKKRVWEANVTSWQRIKNKFAGSIDN